MSDKDSIKTEPVKTTDAVKPTEPVTVTAPVTPPPQPVRQPMSSELKAKPIQVQPEPSEILKAARAFDFNGMTDIIVKIVRDVLSNKPNSIDQLKECIDVAASCSKYVDHGKYAQVAGNFTMANDDHRFAAFVTVLIGAKRFSILNQTPVTSQISIDKIGISDSVKLDLANQLYRKFL